VPDQHQITHGLPEHVFLQRYWAAYAAEMAHFVAAIRDRKPVRTTIADGIKTLELAAAALLSWREKRGVALSSRSSLRSVRRCGTLFDFRAKWGVTVKETRSHDPSPTGHGGR
jgi:hypothetical protein